MAFPPYVAPGQPITSGWGNAVSNSFNDVQAGINDINSRLQFRIKGGYSALTTDSNGDVSINFGQTFASPPLIVATMTAVAGVTASEVITIQSVTTTGFVARITWTSTGAPTTFTTVAVNWIAFIGWLH